MEATQGLCWGDSPGSALAGTGALEPHIEPEDPSPSSPPRTAFPQLPCSTQDPLRSSSCTNSPGRDPGPPGRKTGGRTAIGQQRVPLTWSIHPALLESPQGWEAGSGPNPHQTPAPLPAQPSGLTDPRLPTKAGSPNTALFYLNKNICWSLKKGSKTTNTGFSPEPRRGGRATADQAAEAATAPHTRAGRKQVRGPRGSRGWQGRPVC